MSQSKQVNAPTRPCLSCGGLGTDAASGHMTLRGFVRDSCPVCLGSGRVEAKPSARDAVADAETLNAYINAKTDDGNAYTDNSDEAWFVRLRLGQMRVNRNPARALAAIPGLRGE